MSGSDARLATELTYLSVEKKVQFTDSDRVPGNSQSVHVLLFLPALFLEKEISGMNDIWIIAGQQVSFDQTIAWGPNGVNGAA